MRWISLLLILTSLVYAEIDEDSAFSLTEHTIQLESGPLDYSAIAGFIPLPDDVGTEIFFIAYFKDTEGNRIAMLQPKPMMEVHA